MTTLKQAIDQAGEAEKHADPIDIASDRSQQEIEHRVREARDRVIEQEAVAAASFTGRCLQCGDSVEPPRRWCDKMCASDYEAAKKARVRRGY